MNCLILEDNEAIFEVISEEIEVHLPEVNTTSAETLLEATKHMNKEYDILISDVSLPDGKSVDFVKRFSKEHPNSKIIIMSGYLTDQVLYEFKDIDISYFVQKPFNIEDFVLKISEILDYSFFKSNHCSPSDDLVSKIFDSDKNNSILLNLYNSIPSNLDKRETIKAMLDVFCELTDSRRAIFISNQDNYLSLFGIKTDLKDDPLLKSSKISTRDSNSQFLDIIKNNLGIGEFSSNCKIWENIYAKESIFVPITINNECSGIFIALFDNKVFKYKKSPFLKIFAAHCSDIWEIKNADDFKIKGVSSLLLNLAKIVENKDSFRIGHSTNVARISVDIAKRLDLLDSEIDSIYRGAILHDIGRVALSEEILFSDKIIDSFELNEIKLIPELGYNMIKDIKPFDIEKDIILYHKEMYNGKGYPKGLISNLIPEPARIVSIANAADAMMTDRRYRKALGLKKCIRELESESSEKFDPKIVKIAIQVLRNLYE